MAKVSFVSRFASKDLLSSKNVLHYVYRHSWGVSEGYVWNIIDENIVPMLESGQSLADIVTTYKNEFRTQLKADPVSAECRKAKVCYFVAKACADSPMFTVVVTAA